MSDVATFEFQASIDLYSIQQEVAKYWTGNGRNVDVYVENPVRTFCVLEYFYGRVEEREMLCKVASRRGCKFSYPLARLFCEAFSLQNSRRISALLY